MSVATKTLKDMDGALVTDRASGADQKVDAAPMVVRELAGQRGSR